jgi:hypothetical protein
MLDKSCFITAKAFNISDWDFWQSLGAFYRLGNWASRKLSLKFKYRSHPTHTLSLKNLCRHKLLPRAKRSVSYHIWLWKINNFQTLCLVTTYTILYYLSQFCVVRLRRHVPGSSFCDILG